MPPAPWIGSVVLLTLGLVAAQVVFLPVPSPVATGRRLRKGRRQTDPTGPPRSPAGFAGAVLAASGPLPVLWACLAASVLPMEVPSPDLAHGFLAGLAALLQASGCAVIYTAAITLRRGTGFTTDGQSRRLVTRGVFSLLRHPIAVGLGLVYAGLLAAAPNPWTAFGLAAFTLHQRRQAAAEEILLRRRFGSEYESYRHRTGRFWPKPGRSPTTTEE